MDAQSSPRTGRLVLVCLLAAFAAGPHTLSAQQRMLAGTPHDFSRLGPNTAQGDLGPCSYCHTPEGRVLEGDVSSAASYRVYGADGRGPQLSGAPSGPSLLCLSCHDGSMAGDATNRTVTSLGKDLTNDHPISLEYDPLMDGSLHSAADVIAAGLKLHGEGGRFSVECTTCHDPHDNSLGSFLRRSNEGSRLCFTCHNK